MMYTYGTDTYLQGGINLGLCWDQEDDTLFSPEPTAALHLDHYRLLLEHLLSREECGNGVLRELDIPFYSDTVPRTFPLIMTLSKKLWKS